MAITDVNNYASYTNYYTDTKQKSSSQIEKNTMDKQSMSKTYSNTREYRDYLTEKYDCLKSSDYSVSINSSLLSEAFGDEKTKKWLEYNLALIPKAVDGIKSAVEARGAKLVSCSIKINGYDSMTAEVCTIDEADPGTEKARKELKERIEKKREEKKAEEKKTEKRAEEQRAIERRMEEREKTAGNECSVTMQGTDVKNMTQSFVSKWNFSNTVGGGSLSCFDVKA